MVIKKLENWNNGKYKQEGKNQSLIYFYQIKFYISHLIIYKWK